MPAPLLARYHGVEESPKTTTPNKNRYDNVPTDELSIADPSQLVILKKRFRLVVTTMLASIKVTYILKGSYGHRPNRLAPNAKSPQKPHKCTTTPPPHPSLVMMTLGKLLCKKV